MIAVACCSTVTACGSADETGIVSTVGPARPAIEQAAASLLATHPIVFASDRAEPGSSDLYLLSLDGDVRRVTWTGGMALPKWSPRGDDITFREQIENSRAEVGLITPDGSEQVLLTDGEDAVFWSFAPNWALDGEAIAYASRREPETTWLWEVSRQGGSPARVFRDDLFNRREIAWSPDGQHLAYADYDRAAATHGDGISLDIWVASAAAPAAAVNLTQGRVHAPINLRWSPDSTRIAFQAFALNADGSVEGTEVHVEEGPYLPPDEELFVLDASSGDLTRLTDNDANDREPSWSPDGQSMVIMSDRDGDDDIWLLPLNATDPARDLIDDAADPNADDAPDWFWGSR
jgi:TolB protein